MEQIQPLQSKIRELEHAKETSDGEKRLLEEDRDRWQKRTQDIISKYDRIDPAEMEQLRETIESLRAERDSLLDEQQPLQEKNQALEAEKATWQQSRTKIVEQAKERSRQQTDKIRDLNAEKDSATKEKEALQQELSPLIAQLDAAIQEKEAAEQQLVSLGHELEAVKTERDVALASAAQPASAQASATVPEIPGDEALVQQLADLRRQLDIVMNEKQSLEAQLADIRTQLKKALFEREAAVREAAEALSQVAKGSGGSKENGHDEGQIDETTPNPVSDDECQALKDRVVVAEAKAAEAEQKAAEIESQIEASLKSRSDKMKATLNKKLAESRETQKATLEAEYKLKIEQERAIFLLKS